jgi:hypothetical protein
MSFEMNNSWLNLTNQSLLNENDERFNFKATSEGQSIFKGTRRLFNVDLDFFNREGERFMREDPMVPFSSSVLTDITQNADQSWAQEQELDVPACSTTTFFMAKSSTPDEMLNALLIGRHGS